ncbi:MAG: hypothetical protein ACJ71Y_03920 [Blastococcus sp.]
MSATPAPWSAAAPQLMRSTLPQRWSVQFSTAAGAILAVDIATCEVTIDLGWSPYAQATLTGPVPQDQATLDALDPRRLVKVVISAGYVLPGGVEDVHPLAVLFVRNRDVDRPSNTLTLQAQGPEWLYDPWVPHRSSELVPVTPQGETGYNTRWAANDAVLTTLRLMTGKASDAPPSAIPPGGFDYDNAPTVTGWGYDGPWARQSGARDIPPVIGPTDLVPARGQSAMDFLRDIADRINAWMYCDELGVWRLVYPPGFNAQSAVQLDVGAAGIVLESTTSMSRDEWANDVLVDWIWTTTDSTGQEIEHRIRGEAWIVTGPYARDVARRTTHYELRETAVAQTAATDTARRILQRCAPLGRTIVLTAVAAYWLRPYDTVTVKLPTGPQERHQVQQVSYQLDVGTMRVSTRQPIDATTITGG